MKTLKVIPLLFPKAILTVLGMTTLNYVLIDLFPIQSIGPFQYHEARIVVSIWQAMVWALYSFCLSFVIYYHLGFKKGLTQLNFVQFVSKNITEYITAQLRIVINTSLWFLAFIIPGFIMDARFRVAPLVVFFHPHFHQDRSIDPLKVSLKKIPLTQAGAILFLISLVFICPLVFDSIFEHAHFMFEPRGRIVQILLYSLLNIFTYSYVFTIYLNSTEETNV